jgi:hypothetical protein
MSTLSVTGTSSVKAAVWTTPRCMSVILFARWVVVWIDYGVVGGWGSRCLET